MRGLGTIVNTLAVLLGGAFGLWFRRGIKESLQESLQKACGLATIFIGISGAMAEMLTYAEGKFSTKGTLLLVFALVIGALIGEWIDIDRRLDILGEKLKQLARRGNDSKFVDGFVSATLVICIGAMAVVGSLQDGITGDHATLFVKALLDFVIVMVFASSLGLGALFSAIPLAIYQGLITLFAVLIAPYMTDAMISGLSFVGSVLICGVGINLLFGKTVKVANLLPALLVPVAYTLGQMIF
ncbi:MAG: DUF554 domain-containing protein [Ruminococcaceae bacterium]|nr:DUF554 domain-containing protein [Oscillospiraceae bacterium]